MTRTTISLIAKWIAGFCVSLVVIWAITAAFTENYYPKVWSEVLRRNVPAPGWHFDNKIEASARTEFGQLGLAGIADIRASSNPKVVIWGDSFVEAFQVPDPEKMHRVLTSILGGDGGQQFDAVAVGRRFQSFADYIFQIPGYERAFPDCRLHVIHLHTLDDIYPDRKPEDRISRFLTQPSLHFERYDNEFGEIEAPEKPKRIRDIVYRARLQFFMRLKKQLTDIARFHGLRFRLGTQSAKGAAGEASNDWSDYLHPEWVLRSAPVEVWEFALQTLRETTELPILVIYAPPTPTLEKGHVVEKNPEEELAKTFERLCREAGFGFVNLEGAFLNYQNETGKFPRGFPTSRPWEGHYNAAGHRLAAEAIRDWIRQNPDVIHPD